MREADPYLVSCLAPQGWSLVHLIVLLLLLPALLAFLGRFQLNCGWGGGQSLGMGPGSGGRKGWSGTGAGNRRFFQTSSAGQAAWVACVCVYLLCMWFFIQMVCACVM